MALISSSGSSSDDELAKKVEAHFGGIDKSDWGPGPWQWEPDDYYAEYYGFHCYASRHPSWRGNWCGYIEIPSDHRWYGDRYDEVRGADDGWVEVHGGLTYGDWGMKHVTDGFVLGFDCGHGGDHKPALEARSRGRAGIKPDIFEPIPDSYRTLHYVLNELKGLARQARDVWEL